MLDVGESAQAEIQARRRWNDTGIELVSGHEYHFAARGRWTDLWYECDADGYTSPNPIFVAGEWLRRSPRSRWFALIGAVNADKPIQFEIGVDRTLLMPVSGTLTCFANDLPWTYWNNSGSVQLTVTRTR